MAAAVEATQVHKEGAGPAEQGGRAKKKTWVVTVLVSGAMLALAFVAAIVTAGKKQRGHAALMLDGPFVAKLSSSEIQVNLAGESSKRYLVMALNVEYLVYDQRYVASRLVLPPGAGVATGSAGVDPIFTARVKDALLKISASKTRDEVTNPALADAFMEEIRRAVDPILFPVHVGDALSLSELDHQSGIRAGESVIKSSLRGLLYEHLLHFDGPAGTLALDDGEAKKFADTDRDLELANKAGETVFVDLSACDREFKGDVPIGRPGRVTQVYRESFLIQ